MVICVIHNIHKSFDSIIISRLGKKTFLYHVCKESAPYHVNQSIHPNPPLFQYYYYRESIG